MKSYIRTHPCSQAQNESEKKNEKKKVQQIVQI